MKSKIGNRLLQFKSRNRGVVRFNPAGFLFPNYPETPHPGCGFCIVVLLCEETRKYCVVKHSQGVPTHSPMCREDRNVNTITVVWDGLAIRTMGRFQQTIPCSGVNFHHGQRLGEQSLTNNRKPIGFYPQSILSKDPKAKQASGKVSGVG